MSLDCIQNVSDLTEKMNFGFYESILMEWTGKVKVISSMGKQTTGKSYTLNHLTGSSFNIAGTRCTDGCWMTVKEHADCLYVILDFEGLGSFERTEQDDMMLSLFNSAVSTATIFKTEKRLDRDAEKLFHKINMGSDQLKGNDKIFQGKFMIVINDVAEQDVNDTPQEFLEKIDLIVSKSETNFLNNLYNGGFETQAFPAFESKRYYKELENLLRIIKFEIEHIFTSGLDFLQIIKMVMAKLAINDFTPLDRQQIEVRIRSIKSVLPFAIKFGQMSGDVPKRKEFDLKSFDDSTFQVTLKKNAKIVSTGIVTLNDFETIFDEEFLDYIVIKFTAIKQQDEVNFKEWRNGLEQIIYETIKFRFERVSQWLDANCAKWKFCKNSEFDELINEVIEDLERRKMIVGLTYKFCAEDCKKCYVKCTQIVSHRSEHKCSTNHCYPALCEYCKSDGNKCKLLFGHDGKHVCKEINHVCGEKCKFNGMNQCEGECQKNVEHEGDHVCSEKQHPCKNICSVEMCEGRCTIECVVKHSVHKCAKEQCIEACSVSSCANKCAALDHFHGTDFSAVYKREQSISDVYPFLLKDGKTRFACEEHFCGKEHTCDQICENEGHCRVSTEKQSDEKFFEGERETFKYIIKFAQIGEKLRCRQKLEPFAKIHSGKHLCSTSKHFCVQKCPTCENICDKIVNHEQNGEHLHHTSHGNMRNCFLSPMRIKFEREVTNT